MRILFLTNNPEISDPVYDWLINNDEEVLYETGMIDADYIKQKSVEFIISYNYSSLIKPDVIALLPRRIINLHISYLPYNRGADPNIWSFMDNTPCGVTIHEINEGIDTGDILLQKQVFFDYAEETLGSSYMKLHDMIQKLFFYNWSLIKQHRIKATPPSPGGTSHRKKDAHCLLPILDYNDRIADFLEKARTLSAPDS
jgi:methionyl-tRNA formyltransferase